VSEYALWTLLGIVVSLYGIFYSNLTGLFLGIIMILFAVWDDIHALLKGERFEL